jgi:hypothetical protein
MPQSFIPEHFYGKGYKAGIQNQASACRHDISEFAAGFIDDRRQKNK